MSQLLQHYERAFLKLRLKASSYKHEITKTVEVLFKSSLINFFDLNLRNGDPFF